MATDQRGQDPSVVGDQKPYGQLLLPEKSVAIQTLSKYI